MQIAIHPKNIELKEDSIAYINEKFGRLEHYAAILKDESVKCDVHVEKSKNKTQGLHVEMRASIYVPNDQLRAEVDGYQVNEATDIITEKLERQLEKYKERK